MSTDAAVALDQFRGRVRAWLAEQAPRHGWTPQRDASTQIHFDEDAAEARSRECQALLFEAGFAGISWPTEYGGQGLSVREQLVFNEESQRYSLPLGPYVIGLGMCGPTILAVGNTEQKRRYIEPMLRGEEVWCQIFSEPGAGSDVAGLRSRAQLDGSEWVLNGQKVWTSGAQRCQYGLVIARTNPEVPKHLGITMFIVDLNAPGVTIRPIHQMNDQSHFNEIFFDDVRIPSANVVGEVDKGWQAAITTLMNERVSLGAVRPLDDVQNAAALLDLARRRGNGSIENNHIRQRVADIWIREQVVGLLGARISARVLLGQVPGPEGSVAKLVRTDYSKRAAALGLELAGVQAVAWPVEAAAGSMWSDQCLSVPSLSIAGGTDEVLRNIIGERVLGLPREPQVDRDVPFNDLVQQP